MQPIHLNPLTRFIIGLKFFLRSSLVSDLDGNGKLGEEEDTSPRECANFGSSKGGRTILQKKKKIMLDLIGAFYTCLYTVIHLPISCICGGFMSLIYKFAFLLALGTL